MKKKVDNKFVASLTFDIEEYFQVQNLRTAFPREQWDKIPSTVEKNTYRILDILEEFDYKGTFFILGMVAEKKKSLVREIAKRGHEIASHGYGHLLTYDLTDRELEDDLRISKILLEDITGQAVWGYRAPNFSIDDRVIKILKKLGYIYDSSLNLFSLHDRYGSTTIPYKNYPYSIRKYENGLFEIPIASLEICNISLPAGGGAYFRIFPFFIFKRMAIAVMKQKHLLNFYLHPWEFEPEQPVAQNISFFSKFRHYFGLKKNVGKFKRLIEFIHYNEGEFTTIGNLIEMVSETVENY